MLLVCHAKGSPVRNTPATTSQMLKEAGGAEAEACAIFGLMAETCVDCTAKGCVVVFMAFDACERRIGETT